MRRGSEDIEREGQGGIQRGRGGYRRLQRRRGRGYRVEGNGRCKKGGSWKIYRGRGERGGKGECRERWRERRRELKGEGRQGEETGGEC